MIPNMIEAQSNVKSLRINSLIFARGWKQQKGIRMVRSFLLLSGESYVSTKETQTRKNPCGIYPDQNSSSYLRHLDCNICHILPKYSLSKNNFIKNPYKLSWKKEENLNSKLSFRILQTKNIRQAAPSPSLFLILFGRNYSSSNVFCIRRTAFINSM